MISMSAGAFHDVGGRCDPQHNRRSREPRHLACEPRSCDWAEEATQRRHTESDVTGLSGNCQTDVADTAAWRALAFLSVGRFGW